jgi:hypothetical protein
MGTHTVEFRKFFTKAAHKVKTPVKCESFQDDITS